MDQTQDQHPPMQGDDELARALQGGLQFEETPVPGANAINVAPTLTPASPIADSTDPTTDAALLADLPSLTDSSASLPQPAGDPEPPAIHHTHAKSPAVVDQQSSQSNDAPSQPPQDTSTKEEHDNAKKGAGSDLEKLKNSALEDLRPLIGKLNLPAEEKFDTLLLIIRSTDDQTLLNQAHDAAKHISDDIKRAQALLDIIKEIDYFSTKR